VRRPTHRRARLAEVKQRIASLTALRSELERMVDECACGRVADCRVIETLADSTMRMAAFQRDAPRLRATSGPQPSGNHCRLGFTRPLGEGLMTRTRGGLLAAVLTAAVAVPGIAFAPAPWRSAPAAPTATPIDFVDPAKPPRRRFSAATAKAAPSS